MYNEENIHPAFAKTTRLICLIVISLVFMNPAFSQEEEYEQIKSSGCGDCHETSLHETVITDDLSHSIHQELECLDCHSNKDTLPHKEVTGFEVGYQACGACHEDQMEEYKVHGLEVIEEFKDWPSCSDCHGDHDVLPSSVKLAKTHPVNLPQTCGKCHENLDITRKYEILIDHPIEIYENSIHGKATAGGIYVAATCNDCHSTGGSAHKILSPGNSESSINHFNIPETCGKCHKGVKMDFMDGIHGKLVARGETDSPVCTSCHGEHGIISPEDPRSPVSRSRVAEATCSPCHESITLTEKYGLPTDHLISFIDSYHGLKSKGGDKTVANCASCHGAHRILSSADSTSSVNQKNLQQTCGECHPDISPELAATPIHGLNGDNGTNTQTAKIIEILYISAIIVIIGLMVLHWLIDLVRQIILMMKKPQVRRMKTNEVWQHTLLMVSFIALVISGFALRFSESWITSMFFSWERGSEMRGLVHRLAAVVLIMTSIWHFVYMFSKRGKTFIIDMFPKFSDLKEFVQRILFNLGLAKETPPFKRFSYIEKAEYWALIWGNIVMILTGILLWFDNYFIKFLSKEVLDISLIIHYYEAILAALAILVWHLYSTVFNPHVYPMNPSWLTGKMPKDMFKHEHPGENIEEQESE